MVQLVSSTWKRTACEKLFASRHLFAIPVFGITAPFLLLRFGHIPSGGTLEATWNVAGLGALLLGQGLRIWAAGYIGRAGRSQRLKAITLFTAGPYAYTRNPLYLGNFLLCIGVMFLTESFVFLVLSGPIFWTLYLPLIFSEEAFLQQQFGTDYLAYRQTVPRILPKLTAFEQQQGTFAWSNLRKEYLSIVGAASAVFGVKAIEWRSHTVSFLIISGLLLIVPYLLERLFKKYRGQRRRQLPSAKERACETEG